LFDLPYWSDLNVRHCMDVMHVEKNVCDSVIKTVEASFMIESRLSHESRLIHDDESRLIQGVLIITKMMTKSPRE